jgi:hypothetical protein
MEIWNSLSCPQRILPPDRIRSHLSLVKFLPGGVSTGVKRQGHEADHLLPYRAEGKNIELYLHSPIRLNGLINPLKPPALTY